MLCYEASFGVAVQKAWWRFNERGDQRFFLYVQGVADPFFHRVYRVNFRGDNKDRQAHHNGTDIRLVTPQKRAAAWSPKPASHRISKQKLCSCSTSLHPSVYCLYFCAKLASASCSEFVSCKAFKCVEHPASAGHESLLMSHMDVLWNFGICSLIASLTCLWLAAVT